MSFSSYLLRRVKYLGAPDLLDPISNDKDYRTLVSFLENRIIRKYPIQEREQLNNGAIPLGKWKGSTFKQYLVECNAPESVLSSLETGSWKQPCLQFLLDLATEYSFQDKEAEKKAAAVAAAAADSNESGQSVPVDIEKLTISGCWTTFNKQSSEFNKNVSDLADFLKIPKQSIEFANTETVLAACVSALENRLDNRQVVGDDKAFKISDLQKVKSGFDTGDPRVNDIGKILRLLHINNCRSFQSSINQMIVRVQEYTANPKTDQSLSKVGRS